MQVNVYRNCPQRFSYSTFMACFGMQFNHFRRLLKSRFLHQPQVDPGKLRWIRKLQPLRILMERALF